MPIVRVNVPRFHPLATLNSPGLEVSGLFDARHVPAKYNRSRKVHYAAKEGAKVNYPLASEIYTKHNDIDLSGVYNEIESVQRNGEILCRGISF